MSVTSAKAVALLLASVCLTAPAGEGRAQTGWGDGWTRYTYGREEFSVRLPAAPFVWEESRQIPGNPFEREAGRVFGAYSGDFVYTIESYDNPRRSETLDYFANNFLLRGRKEMRLRELASVPSGGREYFRSYTCGGQSTCEETSRVFRTDRHAYIVSVVGESPSQATAREFLDSFTLSAKPEGTLISDAPPAPIEVRMPPKNEPPPNVALPAAASGGALMQREVTRKAILVFRPEPGYTEKARQKQVSGVVRMKMVLGADGRVRDISLVKILPDGLTERAVRAARHMLFIPATKDGRRVSQWVTVEYVFNIY
jgi:TonB family protein